MKKFTRIISGFVLAVVCVIACMGAINVDAASEAVKVKNKVAYNDFKEQMVVKGYDSKGKVVWSYKTKKYEMTELSSTACKVKNDRVYIFEPSKVTVLKKSTGKKVYSKKANIGGSPCVYIDKNNNFYVIGYYMHIIYKYDAKGNMVWAANFESTNSCWPSKITVKNGKVNVKFENEGGLPELSFDAKTGVIM